MEMTMIEYIVHQLNTQGEKHEEILLFEFELSEYEKFERYRANEVIEAMVFPHTDNDHVQSGKISDPTAETALSYRLRANKEIQELRLQIELLKSETERLARCMKCLSEEESRLLELHHFKGYAWKNAARELHMSIRTMMRVRDHAYKTLEKLYKRAARFGAVPDYK